MVVFIYRQRMTKLYDEICDPYTFFDEDVTYDNFDHICGLYDCIDG